MRRLALASFFAVILPAAAHAQARGGIDSRVEELLARMTISEKVGEMTQLTIAAVSRTRGTASVGHELDLPKLENAIVNYNVGSLLNVYDVAYTREHWLDVIRTIQATAAKRRLPIPVLYGIDAVHGHNYMLGATIFPQNIGL